MPALNIRFTQAELEELHQRAEDQGVPVTRLVHDTAVGDARRAAHLGQVMSLAEEIARQDETILKRLADR